MRAKMVNEFLNEKFSSAENALRIDVRWTNKAKNLSEVKSLYITPRVKEYLDKIKTVSFYVLDQRLTNSIPGSLQDRIFICKGVDGETYLINPEGWDYPRYTAHLVVPTEGQTNDNELDETLAFGSVSNRANTTFGSHYPIDQINYESAEDDGMELPHGFTGDEIECDVCGQQVLHLNNGLCKHCIEQGFWKDNQDRVHHGHDDDEKNIPTY
jgi:hypothetical protein